MSLNSVINNITGGLTVNGGYLAFPNKHGALSLVNNIDSLVLSSGTIEMGGGGSTNTITGSTTWSGGTLQFRYANNGWGLTNFSDLSVTAPVNLQLTEDPSGTNYTSSTLPAGTHTLFSVTGTFTGNLSDISVYNNIPFSEVVPGSDYSGVYYNPVNKTFYVSLAPTATTQDTASIEQIALDATGGAVQRMDVTTTSSDSASFTSSSPSPHALSRMRLHLKEAMRSNPQNPWGNLVSAMAESGSEPYVLKFKGDYRVWASPYAVYTRNTGSGGSGTGFAEKDYGMLLGGSHFVKSIQTGISCVVGFGLIDQQMSAKKASQTKGKQFLVGITTNRKIFERFEWISSLYGVTSLRKQDRQGNPSSIQSYIAKSSYKTYLLSFQNELGQVFKLQDNWSVRPLVGIQVGASRRSAFRERLINKQNVDDTFAQRYKTKNSFSGEVYTGAGLRKKWDGERFEGKVTMTYEVGQKSGNGKARTDVSAGNQSLSVSSNTPGRFTQYINLYGSVLDKESNWKLIPSATVTLQRGQRSITTSLKAEYRF